jgi:CHC2 zinc finger
LTGPGKWKTGPCEFHNSTDSLRVNTSTGGWICMACGVKGGDVLAYAMQRHGLEFVQAATMLGAYVDDGRSPKANTRPSTLPARDAMQLVSLELGIAVCVIADVRAGVIPSDTDWQRFLETASRVQTIAEEFA